MSSTILLILHVVIALLLIGLVLTQTGSSRTMPIGGASQTLFGSQGSGSFMTRLTGITACLFFATGLGLRLLKSHNSIKNTTFSSQPPHHTTMPLAKE